MVQCIDFPYGNCSRQVINNNIVQIPSVNLKISLFIPVCCQCQNNKLKFHLFFCNNIFLVADLWLSCYYFHMSETQYGFITLSIIILPAVLCQIYSLWLLRTDRDISGTALVMHIVLLGIPYRCIIHFSIFFLFFLNEFYI